MIAKRIIACALVTALLGLCADYVTCAEKDDEKKSGDPTYMAFFDTDTLLEDMLLEAEKFVRADNDLGALLKYREALEYTLTKVPSAMRPLSDAPEKGTIRYIPCSAYCRDRVFRADNVVLEKYRKEVEFNAAEQLQRAADKHDSEAMLAVARYYPLTDSGTAAAVAAGDVARENCDNLRASYCYDIALRAYAELQKRGMINRLDYAVLIAKAAGVFAERNDAKRLAGIKALLDADAKLARMPVEQEHGQVEISKIVDEALAEIKPEKPLAPGDYPTFGGSNARGMIQDDPPTQLNTVVWRQEVKHRPAQANLYFGDYEKMHLTLRRAFFAPEPVVYDGKLLVNTGHSLMAMNAADGSPGIGGKLLHAETGMRYMTQTEAGEFCAVSDGKIFLSIRSPMQIESMIFDARAVAALDAKTGRMLWHSKDSGMLPNEAACTAPTVTGKNVIFSTWLRGDANNKFFMVCLDADSGKIKWRCPLVNSLDASVRGSSDIIALKDDMAILVCACGVIFGVDITYGEIKWAMHYDQDYSKAYNAAKVPDKYKDCGSRLPTERMARYWCVNSPIIAGDNVIVSPMFSKYVMSLKIENGEINWPLELDLFDYIAGVDIANDTLYVVHNDVCEYSLSTNKIKERTPIPALDKKRARILSSDPAGRPAMTKDAIYISTSRRLFRYDRKTRKIEKVLEWADYKMQPGNLMCTRDRLFVVNLEEIVALGKGKPTPAGEDATPIRISSER